jgi:hypothetical protein
MVHSAKSANRGRDTASYRLKLGYWGDGRDASTVRVEFICTAIGHVRFTPESDIRGRFTSL